MTDALKDIREKLAGVGNACSMSFTAALGPSNGLFALWADRGSLDAAKALHDALLPRWWDAHNPSAITFARMDTPHDEMVFDAVAPVGMESRAWLLAIMDAIIAQEGRADGCRAHTDRGDVVMTKIDGEPAFPVVGGIRHSDGMTLRDWFAGQALAGILAGWPANERISEARAAEISYHAADAMIAERDAQREEGTW